jgi:hypothetical protein
MVLGVPNLIGVPDADGVGVGGGGVGVMGGGVGVMGGGVGVMGGGGFGVDMLTKTTGFALTF